MLNKFRKRLSGLIAPGKNAMTLPKQYLKYGGDKMYSDWTQVVMRDEDSYVGYGYAAVTRRANKVARTAIENIRTHAETEEIVHPYLEIIENSRTFSDYAFWRDISTYLDLEGVYYLMALRNSDGERTGNVKEFKMLNPYEIRRVMDKDQLEVAGYIENRKGQIREIPKEMIIEMRELYPFDKDKTFSMADAAKESQFTLKTSGDYTRHALKHNINSPGIVTTDVILEEEDFKQFTERVREHKKGEPIFGNGSGAITYENMDMQLTKAALKEVTEISREQLFAVSGTSKTMMGIEESGTTRETARLQRDLNTEDHIIPRIQLIIDALNQDYFNNYRQEGQDKIFIVVDNPMATDHEAELKESEVKTSQFDLFTSLVNKGYDVEIAAQYAMGDIDLDALGEPTNDPIMPVLPLGAEVDDEKEENELKKESGLIKQQEGALQNAIVNAEEQLAIAAINKVAKNQFEEEEDIITKTEKKSVINEIALVMTVFYGIMINLKGQEVMRRRKGQFALDGQYKLDKRSKDYIKQIARKVSEGHVDTVLDDLLVTARESALKGMSVPQIQAEIKQKYSGVIAKGRAKAIARTETNRAFTRAQFEADRQFIDQNGLQKRAFKQWRTRSENPCPFCLSLEAEGPQPFFDAFRELGDTVEAGGKTLDVNFEALEAGNAHTNCSCEYELIIEAGDNALNLMEAEYAEMDKRTKEARELLDEIKAVQNEHEKKEEEELDIIQKVLDEE